MTSSLKATSSTVIVTSLIRVKVKFLHQSVVNVNSSLQTVAFGVKLNSTPDLVRFGKNISGDFNAHLS